MNNKVLYKEDFITQAKNEVEVSIEWCHVNERLQVNLNGVDVYLLLTEVAISSLEDSFGHLKPEYEYDNIDVPTYYELNQ